jgi:hypothetical protein
LYSQENMLILEEPHKPLMMMSLQCGK